MTHVFAQYLWTTRQADWRYGATGAIIECQLIKLDVESAPSENQRVSSASPTSAKTAVLNGGCGTFEGLCNSLKMKRETGHEPAASSLGVVHGRLPQQPMKTYSGRRGCMV